MEIVLWIIPSLICSIGTFLCLPWLHLVAAGVLLLFVCILPSARRKENMFAMFWTAITFIPLNLDVVQRILTYVSIYEVHWTIQLCGKIVIYAFVFNIEEIVVGIITALIRPKQESSFD